MWRMTAPALVACTGCGHMIAQGQPVLSEAPEELPASVARGQFRHFHISCQDCKTGGVCYQTYAAKQPTHTAEEEAACACCGEAIWLRQQFTYDYSLVLRSEDGAPGEPSPGLGLLLKRITAKLSPFEDLSAATQRIFRRAGLGGSRGLRTTTEAAEFYRSSVPWSVRAQGKATVREFINGKHASHVESFANNPHLGRNPENVLWEAAEKNQRRGARNMPKSDQLGARAKNIGAGTGKLAAKSAWFAALWEAPVSAAENAIRVARRGLSRRKAAEHTATDAARAAVSGAAIAVAVTVLRVGFLANPVVAWAGTGIFAVSTAQRLIRAWQESPLTPLVLYFHPDCFPRYAAELSAPPGTD